jgi:transposase
MSSTRNTTVSPSGSKRHPEEIRSQAVDLFDSALAEHKTRQATAKHVAGLLGVKCFDTVLTWVRQPETDNGARSGVTTEDSEEFRRLRREVAELRRANGILRAASVFSRPSSTGHRTDSGIHRQIPDASRSGRPNVASRANM